VKKFLHYVCILSLITLITLCLLWETWLAPLKPGGSLLVLKTLPLLIPLFGILREKIYTYQWSSMFVLIYFIEGVTRAWSETGLSSNLAKIEIALAVVFFTSAIFYIRSSRSAA
jgi:uncharacterized membrane protein